jgi:peptide/nickel transport system substrate-binding protein
MSNRLMATGVGTALAVCSLVAVLVLSLAGSAGASAKSYPRSQTLITSGTQWGNIAGTNPYVGNYATGMVGLVNETLLRYNPLKDKYIDWLAKSAKWTGAKQYTVVVRPGIRWANGKHFTGGDVRYNVNLGRFKTAFWNTLWLNLKPIKVKGNTVVFNFKGTPNYIQWQNLMWNLPMISPAQAAPLIKTAADLTTYSPRTPVGTGPYRIDPNGWDPTTRVVYVRKASWWASTQHVSKAPRPKYIIDLVNTSNTNSLSAVLAGDEDLNNNFLPGVDKLVKQHKVLTYYKKSPYMLSANTAWLEPNTTVKPLNDPVFRRALAEALNPSQYARVAEAGLVRPANSTGLLPTWSKYKNNAAVKKYGFKHSATAAKKLLENHGYKLVGGYFVNKDGSPINLDISVPQGWSDWETARSLIVANAAAAGIRITPKVKDYNTWQSDRNTGKFDLVIDNAYQISDNPWTYWNGIFHLPIIKSGTGQTFANFERYSNVKAWNLVKKLDRTPPSQKATIAKINTQLQTIEMQKLPLIPLWYNGVWAQFTSKYWTEWPAAGSDCQWMPAMWRGYLQMTGIDMITSLKPAK